MGSISEAIAQSKAKLERLWSHPGTLPAVLIVFVGLTSFWLGNMAGQQNVNTDLGALGGVGEVSQLTTYDQLPTTEINPVLEAKNSTIVVVSKNGSKYHLLWCPGAKQMKEENKIFFETSEEAQSAGYEPAANCKGL